MRLPDQRLAAQRLDTQLGDPLLQLGAEDLGHRRQRARVLARGQRRLDALFRKGQRQHLAFAGGHLVRPHRIVAQAAAAGGGLPRGDLLQPLQLHAQRRRVVLPAPFKSEQVLGHRPAVVLLAHPIALGHPHIVEKHLALLRNLIETDDGLNGDPRGVHIQQQEGDARLGLAVAAGAHQQEHAVGVVGVGGPDLGAVDHIVVAVALREGLQRRQIGTGAGLGIALAPDILAGKNARQIMRLLLLGAEADQTGPAHLQAHGNQRRRLGAHQLLGEHRALADTPACAAILFRPVRRRPALCMQKTLPGHRLLHRREHRGGLAPRLQNLRGQRFIQERTHLLAEMPLLLGYS